MSQLRVNSVTNLGGTGSIYLPGSVVQFVDYKYPSTSDTYVTISGGTAYQTAISVTITPKFATSRLVIHAEAQTRTVAGFGTTLGIKRDGVYINGSINYNSLDFFYKGDSVNHHKQMIGNTSVLANSTAATTFTVWITPYSDTGEWNTGWGNNYIQVWEIAQ